MKHLELLAPAKDFEHGVAAIDYGADAVYIAASRFGARSAAGNPMSDIRRLTDYAHTFGAKVYVAINTIIYDSELVDAERIAKEAWMAGADALIVQDMAFLAMNLPSIELHASTQAFSNTPEKCAFMKSVGFSRVILERGLTLKQIQEINASTDIELEAFVHGAICVCYSGQCYMSQAIAGRSGNRGECQQPCRWDFSLLNSDRSRIGDKKHYLSVRDFNLSENLESLIDAGVTSFKIEGRLKDMTYLKNSVGHYRQRLDSIIARRSDLARSSYGTTIYDFTPDPDKSFSRGFSDYFLKGRQRGVASFDTPKSIGEFVGKVRTTDRTSFTVEGGQKLANGDGICFVTSSGATGGTNINNTDGDRIFPNRMDGITSNALIYKNFDHSFQKALEASKTNRKIVINTTFYAGKKELKLTLTDETGNSVTVSLDKETDIATNPDKARETIVNQLSKTGDTPFKVNNIEIISEELRFVPASVLNELRRTATDALLAEIRKNYRRKERKTTQEHISYPTKNLTYKGNVVNALSEKFYRAHGVESIERGLELTHDYEGREVMRTPYCIRRELGRCTKKVSENGEKTLYLENERALFELGFDCEKCEMTVIYREKR